MVLDLERCRAKNVTVVQRITGGGVIYHADELTYAIVCAPQHLPGETTVKESFRYLTGFLLTFYRELGLPAAYAADVSNRPASTSTRRVPSNAGCEFRRRMSSSRRPTTGRLSADSISSAP